MPERPRFVEAFGYQDDLLGLPVADHDAAARWYAHAFGMTEVERRDAPCRSVIMERDGVRFGFAENGGDPSQDGAAIHVSDLALIKQELRGDGVEIGAERVDERAGQRLDVFFVIAPDGLFYYFHQPINP